MKGFFAVGGSDNLVQSDVSIPQKKHSEGKLVMSQREHKIEDKLLADNTVRERLRSPAVKQEFEDYEQKFHSFIEGTTDDEMKKGKTNDL